jgi:hypothetical protein
MVGTNEDIWENEIDDRPDTQCSNSRIEGCTLKWNLERQYFLNGLKDGSYEIRAKVFCSGYDAFATAPIKGSVTDENLSLSVDVQSPMALETTTLSRVFKVEYSERIICPQLNADHMTYQVKRIKSCDGKTISTYGEDVSSSDIYLHYDFVCLPGDRGSLAVKWPGHPTSKPGMYEVTVNADKLGTFVQDANGNIAEKQTFQTSWIDCASSSATATSFLGDELKEQSKSTNLTTDRLKQNVALLLSNTYSRVAMCALLAMMVMFITATRKVNGKRMTTTLSCTEHANETNSLVLSPPYDTKTDKLTEISSKQQQQHYGAVL